MPFKSIKKSCLWCHKPLKLNNNRDIKRKKYCSHGHRMLWRYAHGEFWHLETMQKLASTPKANLKKSHKGANHPNWIKDRTQLKQRPRYEMTIWRLAVFQRDNYTCQDCGIRGYKLQADHIKSYAKYPELRWDINNGRTLCIDCHKNTQSYGRKVLHHSL